MQNRLKDFIFIIGPSGVGKTTLAKNLFAHYKSVYIEQNMIPEFISLDGNTEMTGELEELTCWAATVALLKSFNSLGYKNVIGLDFNDLRTRDIPEEFLGYDYITIKLLCSDYSQNLRQMLNRGSGLIDEGLLEELTYKIMNRKPLVNEFVIDVSGKTPEAVAQEAIELINHADTQREYSYSKPAKELFYSWVWDDNLRTK